MAVTNYIYGNALVNAFSAKINFPSDTIKVALLTNSYTPNQDTHDFFDDVTTYQITATGYTAGGATLASKTLTYTGATNVFKIAAANVSWTFTGAGTARYAVVYDATPSTDATRPLIAYVDFGEDKTATDGTFQLTWNADGICTVTVS